MIWVSSTSIPGFRFPHSCPVVSLSANSSPLSSRILLSKPHVLAPSPCPHWWTHVTPSLAYAEGCGTDHLYRPHSVLSAIDQLLVFSSDNSQSSPYLQLISPVMRGFPWMGISPVLQPSLLTSAQGINLLHFLSPFPFSFCVLPGYAGSFLSF